MFEWKIEYQPTQMWVAYWEDQTVFGPFFSIKEANEKLYEAFGPNYRNFIRVFAIEPLTNVDQNEKEE